jgi:hypothetical protein
VTPTPHQAGMTLYCVRFYLVVKFDTCYEIAKAANISLTEFYEWNPDVRSDCASLLLGYWVCVRYCPTCITSATATTSIATTTQAGAIMTPTPIQPGMISSCVAFYLVVSGDDCYAISKAAGISLKDFYYWNPAIGNDCSSLWIYYFVCVSIYTNPPSATPTESLASPTQDSAIATPQPTQTGMTRACSKFHLVVEGDTCPGICGAGRISVADFIGWNPAVGFDCTPLWLGYWVCIAVLLK